MRSGNLAPAFDITSRAGWNRYWPFGAFGDPIAVETVGGGRSATYRRGDAPHQRAGAHRDDKAAPPGLKVLYMTGYSRNAIVHQGRLDAGVSLMQKPFSQNVLAMRVRTTLEQA